MTMQEVQDMLKQACAEAGSQLAWARAHGVSGAYVNDVVQGRRDPGDAILAGLGLERVVTYRLRAEKRVEEGA